MWATSFRFTPVELYSDINIRDSIDDGKSYFQVEVERVKDIIVAAGRSRLVLAIVDELFRGTNSEERNAISYALLHYLREQGILVLLATHDGQLAKSLEEEQVAGISNHHFEETVEKGNLSFEYRLLDGPAGTRNAILVLQANDYPAALVASAKGRVELLDR